MKSEQTIKWCDQTIVFSFYFLAFLLPISTFFVEMFSGIIITTYSVKRGILAWEGFRPAVKAAGRSGFIRKVRILWGFFKPAANPLNEAIKIFLLVNLLSVVFSHNVPLSLKGFIFKLFQSVMLFYGFVESMKSKKEIQTFVGIFFASALLVTVNGFVQHFRDVDFMCGKVLQDHRVMSCFKHPNDFGAYLIIVLLLYLPFVFNGHLRREVKKEKASGIKSPLDFSSWPARIGLAVFLMMALSCLGWTFSRGAWVGFVFGMLVVGLQRKKAFPFLLLIVLAFFAFFVPRLANARNVSFVTDDIDREKEIQVEQARQESSVSPQKKNVLEFAGQMLIRTGREDFWRKTINIIRQYPALGIGLNTYSKLSNTEEFDWIGGYPHNCYLQMAAETGVLGVASFLWILFVLFWNAVKGLRSIKDKYFEIVLLGCVAGLTGFLGHSFVDTTLYSVKLGNLLWIMMGLMVAVQLIAKTSEQK